MYVPDFEWAHLQEKLFAIYIKLKFNWAPSVFICSI